MNTPPLRKNGCSSSAMLFGIGLDIHMNRGGHISHTAALLTWWGLPQVNAGQVNKTIRKGRFAPGLGKTPPLW